MNEIPLETIAEFEKMAVSDSCITCAHLMPGPEPGTFQCERNGKFKPECPLWEKYRGHAS
jgi:hypothetical protein